MVIIKLISRSIRYITGEMDEQHRENYTERKVKEGHPRKETRKSDIAIQLLLKAANVADNNEKIKVQVTEKKRAPASFQEASQSMLNVITPAASADKGRFDGFLYRSAFPTIISPPVFQASSLGYLNAMRMISPCSTLLPFTTVSQMYGPNLPLPIPQSITRSSTDVEEDEEKRSSCPRPSVKTRVQTPILPQLPQQKIPENSSMDSKLVSNDFSSTAYRRRNVYKSIIRHMHGFINRHSNDAIRMLGAAGYSVQEIEHAFFKVNAWNNLEKQAGTSKKSQATVEKILRSRAAVTFILREALFEMMQRWVSGKTGKISEENIVIYKEVCEKYYERTIELTGQRANCICSN